MSGVTTAAVVAISLRQASPPASADASPVADADAHRVISKDGDASRKASNVFATADTRAPCGSQREMLARRDKFACEVAVVREALRNETGFVVDPNCAFMRRWDMVTILALFFTAVVTPYEVAVLETSLDALFVANRFIDAVFVFDMGLQFVLMYRASDAKGGAMVRDTRKIRQHYLRGWFVLDLVSILPFDIVSFALKDGALGKMKVLRVVRLMRLLKLVRIVRASRIFQRWETSISVSYSALSLCKFMIMIVMVGHWMACAFALLHEVVCDETCTRARSQSTWLVHWLQNSKDAAPNQQQLGQQQQQQQQQAYMPSPHERYTLSMYWSITTLTSIGYGDIVAQTEVEYSVATIFMLIGAICWAYIIAQTCGIVATFGVEVRRFRQTMDQLNRFLEQARIPQALRRELRAYFHQARSLQLAASQKALLEQMSPTLKGRVAICTIGGMLRSVFGKGMFKGAEGEFISDIAQRFETSVYAPNELLDHPDRMYHLVRGVVVLAGRPLSNGAVWGDDMVLSCVDYQEPHAAMTLTYVEVSTLSKETLFGLLRFYPAAAAAMRKATVRMAVRRGLMHEARRRVLEDHKRGGMLALRGAAARRGSGEEQRDSSGSFLLDSARKIEMAATAENKHLKRNRRSSARECAEPPESVAPVASTSTPPATPLPRGKRVSSADDDSEGGGEHAPRCLGSALSGAALDDAVERCVMRCLHKFYATPVPLSVAVSPPPPGMPGDEDGEEAGADGRGERAVRGGSGRSRTYRTGMPDLASDDD